MSDLAIAEHERAIERIRSLHPSLCIVENEQTQVVTDRLFAHVTDSDLADIEASLHEAPEDIRRQFLSESPSAFRSGAVTLASKYSKGDFLRRANLSTALPPPDIIQDACSRTRMSICYTADIVARSPSTRSSAGNGMRHAAIEITHIALPSPWCPRCCPGSSWRRLRS